ncbi:hypothetical protein SELMODRAFT_449202 [Selaginella moellendorffii]|uniref:Uncharacterized protein n=1 Tax=Selaginella moellendorffii TaxID=88036 RepID=D8TDL3_SELML|nr:uncharacterized protein LOC9663527 [Selaginella moellendorffii]XP_024523059.1 uncharacterized protein LOC9663527 [Selaginella moellendorffii]EFJ05275.1 hypothetical protein SELMODRAFT_449202 [Selaginella moellendorffii]|eukprot:XP_002993686.1 uncharacterized protein LOC9663527 [Selaginella moellendorffii]
MGRVAASPKREDPPQTPAGMAGSHLNNIPLSVAMERLGLRSQMRDNGPVVFDGLQQQQQIGRRSKLVQEKAAMDKAIIEIITSGQWERLEPNSSKSIAVGNHHVCVSYDEEMEVGYRTWEWHGHMLLYDEEEGMYKPEYVYGNYFEPLQGVLKIASNVGINGMERMMSLLGRQHRFY